MKCNEILTLNYKSKENVFSLLSLLCVSVCSLSLKGLRYHLNQSTATVVPDIQTPASSVCFP